MLEMEMKFPVQDFAPLRQKLELGGARADAVAREEDHYFNAPDRDFAQTDEALRLRTVGEEIILTYKGPKQAGPAKTRTEIEVPIERGAAAAETCRTLLKHLGYRPTAVVRKDRICYHLRRDDLAVQVTLDEVERVGRYAEVEVVAAEEMKDAVLKVLQQVAAELGLATPEKRSYLEMLLAKG